MPTPRIANLDPDRLSSIMNAAIQEFATYSFEYASFNRIIRNSGLSKGSLYYYFNSKEDLFLTIMDRCLETLKPHIAPRLAMAEPKQFWAETKRLLEKILQFFQDEPELGRFLQMVLAEKAPKHPTTAQHFLASLDDWLLDFLTIGQSYGAIRRDLPLELLTTMVWTLWRTGGNWYIDKEAAKEPDFAPRAASVMTNFFARLLMPGAASL